MIPHFADSSLDNILDASPEQHAAARAYLLKHAPDLIGAILGGKS